jgi:hypothetical protein
MMNQPAASNRRATFRRHPRGKPPVECRRGRTGLGKNLAEEVTDLSQTGAGLMVHESFDAEEEVDITVNSIHEPKPVHVYGSVIRCIPKVEGKYLISVRFERPLPYALWQKLT